MAIKYNAVSLRHKHSPEKLFILRIYSSYSMSPHLNAMRDIIQYIRSFLLTKISIFENFNFSKILFYFILFYFYFFKNFISFFFHSLVYQNKFIKIYFFLHLFIYLFIFLLTVNQKNFSTSIFFSFPNKPNKLLKI